MCETFKWIDLLSVELQKDGLQTPVKIFTVFNIRYEGNYTIS